MPQVTGPLTINNGAAVAKTFSVITRDARDSLFAEKTASPNGTPNGYSRLRVRHSPPTAQRPTYKTFVDLDLPQVVLVDGVDKVVRQQLARVEFTTTADATQTERDNLVAYLINALSNATIKPVFKDNDPLY